LPQIMHPEIMSTIPWCQRNWTPLRRVWETCWKSYVVMNGRRFHMSSWTWPTLCFADTSHC
jgi:hypothetical protein